MTKNSPAKASDSHISIVGHITDEELRRYLTATETANGFGNRFLWFLARAPSCFPEGGRRTQRRLKVECDLLGRGLKFAGTRARSSATRPPARSGASVYPVLAGDRGGLAGSLTGRAEAHVLRLSLIYAVLDRSPS